MGINSAERELQCVWGLETIGGAYDSESVKCFRFLSIFHPEMSLKKRLLISNQYLRKDK
jgi:hypothetical protein